jgi:hypothetical protein
MPGYGTSPARTKNGQGHHTPAVFLLVKATARGRFVRMLRSNLTVSDWSTRTSRSMPPALRHVGKSYSERQQVPEFPRLEEGRNRELTAVSPASLQPCCQSACRAAHQPFLPQGSRLTPRGVCGETPDDELIELKWWH